jgi:hypothetical protein
MSRHSSGWGSSIHRSGTRSFTPVAPYEGDDLAHQALASRFGFRFRHQGTTHAEAVADAARHFAFDQAAVEWRGGVFATRDVEPA